MEIYVYLYTWGAHTFWEGERERERERDNKDIIIGDPVLLITVGIKKFGGDDGQ